MNKYIPIKKYKDPVFAAMMVAKLQEEGIDAKLMEKGSSSYVIFNEEEIWVPEADAARALEVLELSHGAQVAGNE